MRIDFILPTNNARILCENDIKKLNLPSNISCHIALPENDMLEINNADDEEKAIPSIIKAIVNSANDKADAIIVYCFGEPGVELARSIVNTPVFWIAAPSMHMAAQLGKRFLVIASVASHCPLINILADRFGLSSRMGAPVSIDIPPNNLIDNDKLLFPRVLDIIKSNIENNKIDTFVLGCGSMQAKGEAIRQLVKERLGYDVTIIDPLLVSVYFAASVVSANLKPSKLAY